MAKAGPTPTLGVMTADEVAVALGISVKTLSRRMKDRRFPIQPVDWSRRDRIFLRADVDRVLSGQQRVGRRVA